MRNTIERTPKIRERPEIGVQKEQVPLKLWPHECAETAGIRLRTGMENPLTVNRLHLAEDFREMVYVNGIVKLGKTHTHKPIHASKQSQGYPIPRDADSTGKNLECGIPQIKFPSNRF